MNLFLVQIRQDAATNPYSSGRVRNLSDRNPLNTSSIILQSSDDETISNPGNSTHTFYSLSFESSGVEETIEERLPPCRDPKQPESEPE